MSSVQEKQMVIEPWANPPTRKPFTSNGKMLLTKDKNGKDVLVATPTGHPLTFHIIEIDTGAESKIEIPCQRSTCYGLEVACDGRIYGAVDNGELFACDLQTGRAEVIGKTPLAKLTWSSAATPDGRLICFGDAAGTGEIACFDVERQEFVWHMTDTPEDAIYCRRLTALPDGRLAAAWLAGERSRLGIIEPQTGEYVILDHPTLEDMLASALFVWREWLVCCDPKKAELVLCRWDQGNEWHTVAFRGNAEESDLLAGGEKILFVDRPRGTIYELDEALAWQPRCTTSLKTTWSGNLVDDRTVVSVDREGVFRRIDLQDGEQIVSQLDNVTCTALGLHALGYDGKKTVYFGHFINQRFGRIDIDSADGTDLGYAVAAGGQIQDFLALDGMMYIASYGKALLSRYDSNQPAEGDVNPLIVGRAGDHQNRPMALATDGKAVYMASCANYGHLGGAISVYNPQNGTMQTYRHIVRDQQVTTLVCEPRSGLIAAGTFIHGEAHRPTQTQGAFFLWNPATAERAHIEYPFAAEGLRVVGHDGQGRIAVWAWDTPDYCVFDCGRREIVGRYQWSGAQVLATALSGDGSLWALSADGLFQWDLGSGKLTLTAAGSWPKGGQPIWKLIDLGNRRFVIAAGNQLYHTKCLD